MQNINEIFKQQKLLKLIQVENFVGWVYYIDYDKAHVMTNDLWKSQSSGIPHNCFLVAATFNPEQFAQTPKRNGKLSFYVLAGFCEASPKMTIPSAPKVDNYQQQTDIYGKPTPVTMMTSLAISFSSVVLM